MSRALFRRSALTAAAVATATLATATAAIAAPQVTSISPGSGPAGTTITFSGTELSAVSQVQMRGDAIPRGEIVPIKSASATALTVTAPAWVQDTAHFRLFAGGQLVDATVPLDFVYPAAPAPVVTAISPASGPTSGNTGTYITGKNLLGATSVSFGGATATPQISNDGELTVITPAHAPGVVDVTVTTLSGTVTKVGGYTYEAPDAPLPVVARVAPQSVLAGFGGIIQIQGANLANPKSVMVGTKGAFVLSSSSTTIWAWAPGQPKGSYPVAVTGANGTSAPSGNAVLLYNNLF